MAIGYNYNYWGVLGFIATEGDGSTDTGDTYLSCFLENYSNVSYLPVVRPRVLVRYSNAFKLVYNHKRISQCDPDLDKYWATCSDYSRRTDTVVLDMVITYANLSCYFRSK